MFQRPVGGAVIVRGELRGLRIVSKLSDPPHRHVILVTAQGNRVWLQRALLVRALFLFNSVSSPSPPGFLLVFSFPCCFLHSLACQLRQIQRFKTYTQLFLQSIFPPPIQHDGQLRVKSCHTQPAPLWTCHHTYGGHFCGRSSQSKQSTEELHRL